MTTSPRAQPTTIMITFGRVTVSYDFFVDNFNLRTARYKHNDIVGIGRIPDREGSYRYHNAAQGRVPEKLQLKDLQHKLAQTILTNQAEKRKLYFMGDSNSSMVSWKTREGDRED